MTQDELLVAVEHAINLTSTDSVLDAVVEVCASKEDIRIDWVSEWGGHLYNSFVLRLEEQLNQAITRWLAKQPRDKL